MRAVLAAFVAVVAIGCASSVDPNSLSTTTNDHAPKPGVATVDGTLPGLSLQSAGGVSIARSVSTQGELMIAATNLACQNVDASDHLTIDLASESVGTFEVVAGYPKRDGLGAFQARAHACTAKGANAPPCFEDVRGGQIVVTRYDRSPGGRVEGTFRVDFAEATISGTFRATRCD